MDMWHDLLSINIIFDFSKEETDEEAIEIRQKCEDYVININDLQNQILFIKTPRRRVSQIIKRILWHVTIIIVDFIF